jgi:hypothetical protein
MASSVLPIDWQQVIFFEGYASEFEFIPKLSDVGRKFVANLSFVICRMKHMVLSI